MGFLRWNVKKCKRKDKRSYLPKFGLQKTCLLGGKFLAKSFRADFFAMLGNHLKDLNG